MRLAEQRVCDHDDDDDGDIALGLLPLKWDKIRERYTGGAGAPTHAEL